MYVDTSPFLIAVMHGLQLIHTDLKPENILFVSSEHAMLPENKVYIYTLLCALHH
jgi:dual-specificity kinase